MKRFLFIFILSALIFSPISYIEAVELVKILLVPGHDDEVWGTQYGNVKEADMNLSVATEIYNILKEDKRFEIYITRDKKGYTKEFADYFSLHEDEIISFKDNAKAERQKNVNSGSFIPKESVPHVSVSKDIAIKLYGFNKWANDNKINAMVHIHFNDYSRASKWTIGKYSGFVIYMPEGQMANSWGSGQLAANIFLQLKKKYTTSTYPKEKGGLIPDQSLIALGSNGTLLPSVNSVLVEYGYIYEKKFRTTSTRLKAYKDMAKLTADGIQNYFTP